MLRTVASDAGRRFVVPSASGKGEPKDAKVTDLLYLCHELARRAVTTIRTRLDLS